MQNGDLVSTLEAIASKDEREKRALREQLEEIERKNQALERENQAVQQRLREENEDRLRQEKKYVELALVLQKFEEKCMRLEAKSDAAEQERDTLKAELDQSKAELDQVKTVHDRAKKEVAKVWDYANRTLTSRGTDTEAAPSA